MTDLVARVRAALEEHEFAGFVDVVPLDDSGANMGRRWECPCGKVFIGKLSDVLDAREQHRAEAVASIFRPAVEATMIERAIRHVEDSQRTHVEWRDHWLRMQTLGHGDCPRCTADQKIAGGIEHHEYMIVKYTLVLDVLRECREL